MVHGIARIVSSMKYSSLILCLLLFCTPAWGDGDHDRARRTLQSGAILPLSQIVDRALADYPGDLLEAELETDHDRPIYELKIITRQGGMVKLYYDAQDGILIRKKGHP